MKNKNDVDVEIKDISTNDAIELIQSLNQTRGIEVALEVLQEVKENCEKVDLFFTGGKVVITRK